jgi:hypothetical protein
MIQRVAVHTAVNRKPFMTYSMKPLSCDPQRIKGMSEKLIVSHYEYNYGGAVKRLNLIEEKLAELDYDNAAVFLINGLKREQLIAMNSMILHELFFDGLEVGRPLIAFAAWRWIEREDDALPFLSVTALFFVLMSLDGSNVASGDPTFY